MPSKKFVIQNLGTVIVFKRKTNRNLRITLSNQGEIRISIPQWAPYQAGVDFAKSKERWIKDKTFAPELLSNQQQIGRSHRLCFTQSTTESGIHSRISGNQIIISYGKTLTTNNPEVQLIANKAAIRALRLQAESLLPQRLDNLASIHNLTYKSVGIKQLKRRWGSCDINHNIVLNLFLIQLPWELIDYVILHELAHTICLNHSPDFWQELEYISPDARVLRKRLNSYHPLVG